MTCTEFVEGFSDYYDGTASQSDLEAADAHLAACDSCRRYHHVMTKGAELLRALPAPEVNEDFGPRLRHRLYHVDQEAVLRSQSSSGTTALAVVGMALLLSAIAWSPALRSTAPTVELDPIVVSRPPSPMRLRAARLYPVRFSSASPASSLEQGLWDDAPGLLFHHSRLYQRYGQRAALHDAGLEQEQ
jgi:anti-sigma factor RsiW